MNREVHLRRTGCLLLLAVLLLFGCRSASAERTCFRLLARQPTEKTVSRRMLDGVENTLDYGVISVLLDVCAGVAGVCGKMGLQNLV